ncbi:hypothetical protein SLEP1_g57417 [Rubroshorea leprosula]|uniref:NB-ARC domain-containing protein n=1 Tax=Rubroshorea leprosula TaxID=152421 RepID=A0AAV5MPG9_9ROSI|nr:hypothetical protein SLEP1_g57417 [Rubroshorea leprosula]
MVKELLDKCSFPEGLVIDRAPAHGNIIPTENLVGEISTKEEIWRYLMGDKVGMIGICGIGGVGKTTIMKNLHNDLQKETRFQKVIWVTVSHPLNVFELQKKIANAMGERLRDDEEVKMRAAALMEIMTRVRNLEEVARLKKLETLECQFDGIQDFNHFVNKFKDFQSAIAYSLGVGTIRDMNRVSKYELVIIDCEIGEECVALPNNLEYLWIIRGKNMRSILKKTVVLEMEANELRQCLIWESEEMECVVDLDSSSSSSSLCCLVLDKLELLHLLILPKLCELVRVEGATTPPHIFSNLKTLIIDYCSGMRKLLPLALHQALQNLEEIRVWNCKQMEEIIASSDSDASSDKFIFPKLRILWLINLPQLKSIYSAKGVVVCDSIEKIVIFECQELKRIPVQLPLLDNGQPSHPPRLKEIKTDKEWWESMEWDHPNAKNLLKPFSKYSRYPWEV